MIERLFRLLLVRTPERSQVLFFFALFIVIGMALALGRGSKNALFLKRYGIEYIPLMYLLLSVVMMTVTTAYAAWVDRLSSERFFRTLFAALGGLTAISWALMVFSQTAVVYPLYYLVHEIGAELLVIHGALYLSQNLDVRQLQRLTPLVMAGIPVGSIAGGALLATLSPVLGVHNLLPLSVLLTLLAILGISRWHGARGPSPHYRPGRKGGNQWRAGIRQLRQGLRLVGRYRLVTASYLALFFMGVTLTVLWYAANSIYTATFTDEADLGAFFGWLTMLTSGVALLVQGLVTGRALRLLGVKTMNLVFPATTLAAFAALFASFSLWPAMFATFNKDVLMVSIRNPVRNLFFGALPAQVQGRARALSLALVMPLALLVSGALLWTVQDADSSVVLLVTGTLAAVCYLGANLAMNHAYVETILNNLKQRLLLPGDEVQADLRGGGRQVFEQLVAGVRHPDPAISVSFARSLARSFPRAAASVILQRLQGAADVERDQLLRLATPLSPAEAADYLWTEVGRGDAHLRATALYDLVDLQDARAIGLIDQLLGESNPRLAAPGIYAAVCCGDSVQRARAQARWHELLDSTLAGAVLSALEVAARCKPRDVLDCLGDDFIKSLVGIAVRGDRRVRLAALQVLDACADTARADVAELAALLQLLANDDDERIREACVPCYRLLPRAQLDQAVLEALEDSSPQVREAAIDQVSDGSLAATGRISRWLVHENRGSPRAQSAMIHSLLERGVSVHLMQQIALAKINDAHVLARAQALLGTADENAVLKVMACALRERYLQVVDLALLAMQALEDPDSIAVVREGLVSRDSRYYAIAVDVVRNFRCRELAIPVSELMEADLAGSDRAQQRRLPFDGRQSMLEWCARRLDPWLQFCASKALESARIAHVDPV